MLTKLVDVHNEWDPLEEVVIGTAIEARIPTADPGLHAIEFPDYSSSEEIPSGPIEQQIIEQTEIELSVLCDNLTKHGVVVRRPEPRNVAARFSTPDWHSDGFYDYCPRDVLLTIGDMVIETPMALRSRFFESFAYRSLLLEYFESGARWISAPKPRLLDEMYKVTAAQGSRLQDFEPAFDAANVLRFGSDLLYLVSDSGNEMGGRWLQSAVGDAYKVHICKGVYASTHVDSTIVPLRPGLVLLNPERVNAGNMPGFLRSWEKIYAPEMVDTGFVGSFPRCSKWIGMNILVIEPGLAVVDDRQRALIRFLEKHGVDVLALRLTHARSLGGGFHCVSLDVRRRGRLETYK